MRAPIIVISGPTGTGKTARAIEIAQAIGGEVVNFDSLCFYRELSIGTAKPSPQERQLITHHLIDSTSIFHPWNASDFALRAQRVIEQLLRQEKTPILVGGSGFYLQALLFGMYSSQSTPSDILAKSEALYQREGIAPFIAILKENDPATLASVHPHDHYRLRRAVEHWWASGFAFSSAQEEFHHRPSAPLWPYQHFYLDLPKSIHWPLIQQRAARMIDNGLLDEVRGVLRLGASGLERPLQSIGYKQCLEFQQGLIPSIDQLKEKIFIATRRLAKAQRTWFQKDSSKTALHALEEQEKLLDLACQAVNRAE